MSMLFAATYPERTIALVLYGTVADFTGPASPRTRTTRPPTSPSIEETWGTEEFARDEIAELGRPGSRVRRRGSSRGSRRTCARSASPGAAVALERMNREINAIHALASIHVPTLVIARTGRPRLPDRGGDGDMADRIAGARLVELPGVVHFPWVGAAGRDPRRGRAVRRRARRGRGRVRTLAGHRRCSPTSSARPTTASELGDRALEGAGRGAPSPGARAARALPRRRGRHRRRRLLRDVRRARSRRPLRVVDRRRGRAPSASRCGRGSTRARSRRSTARSAAWPS